MGSLSGDFVARGQPARGSFAAAGSRGKHEWKTLRAGTVAGKWVTVIKKKGKRTLVDEIQCPQRTTEDIPLCSLKVATKRPEYQDYRLIQAIVDSGAADHVMPDRLLPDHAAVEGEATRQGVAYTTADGGEIPNLGEKKVAYKTFEGHSACSMFQIADV